jgi:SOS-response transcriptional repressor LexA
MDLKTMGARLRQRRKAVGWTAANLARLCGLDPSFISKLEAGRTNVSQENLVKITGHLGISLDVLYGRKELVDVLADYRTIPLLDAVQAGQWRTVDASTRDEWIKEVISVNMEYPPSTFATRIAGDSMEPRMKAGDVVVVDVTMQPRPGDIVVATNEDGEATIKQYRSLGKNERGLDVFELLPANPLYAPIRSDRENIAIVGVVREHRVFLR